ncbi:hypothetical protein CDAR_277361 [Caerostris darwini]|uniref:Uncharacterized protein n=1 Tax=Caerostris darwini TaxID=1538125 RepID=A0AAV4VU98_9ARAC|nr:hypothetical protein CDAR_277361 [Caerostris darwini]
MQSNVGEPIAYKPRSECSSFPEMAGKSLIQPGPAFLFRERPVCPFLKEKSRYLVLSLTCGIPSEMQSNVGEPIAYKPRSECSSFKETAGKSLIQPGRSTNTFLERLHSHTIDVTASVQSPLSMTKVVLLHRMDCRGLSGFNITLHFCKAIVTRDEIGYLEYDPIWFGLSLYGQRVARYGRRVCCSTSCAPPCTLQGSHF